MAHLRFYSELLLYHAWLARKRIICFWLSFRTENITAQYEDEMPLSLWLQVLGWFLTAVIVIGNGLVVYLVGKKQNLHTTTNWFVLSLALADFGFGTTFVPLQAVCMLNHLCHMISESIKTFFVYASVINLCILTLDRYLAIVKPLRYGVFMTGRRVAVLISAAWGLSMLLLTPELTLQFANTRKNYDVFRKCFLALQAFFELCVCVILLFATVHIFLIARRHARQNAALVAQLNFNHRTQHSKAFKPQEVACVKVLGVVVAFFIFCYSLSIYLGVCELNSCNLNTTLFELMLLLMLANSAVNPLAYALFKKDIKKELKRLFACTGRNRQNATHPLVI